MDYLNLEGRHVLISGGCGALGRAIVAEFLAHGARITVNDILEDEQAARLLPEHRLLTYVKSSTASRREAVELISQATTVAGDPPDTVCCHAGIVNSHPVDEFAEEAFDSMMETNMRSAFLLAQAAAETWKAAATGGHIIFTSSWVANTPWPGIAPYSASKAALNAFTRSFARELAPYGIRSNAIAPGIVGAGMAQRQWDTEPDYRARASRAIPLGQLQTVESVAHSFLFLASDMAAYMTGSVLTVDGGASLYPMD